MTVGSIAMAGEILEGPFAQTQRSLIGYASSTSVRQGEGIQFCISDSLGSPTVDRVVSVAVTRLGGGNVLIDQAAVRQRTVSARSYQQGCGWPASYNLHVPPSWESGIYLAAFGTGVDTATIPFVVKSLTPGSLSRILVLVPFTTIQAYNNWGGKSLYDFNSNNADGINRAFEVSFDRPLATEYLQADPWQEPFVRWLNYHDIAVEYCSGIDLHADPSLLTPYQLLLIAGHDEYWSGSMRSHIDQFVASGGNVAILGGNTCWWQARLAANQNGVANRQLICYKSTGSDADPSSPYFDPVTTSSAKTTHWFDLSQPFPENRTTGLSSREGAIWAVAPPFRPSTPYQVYRASNWVFANTQLANGGYFGGDVVGYETDSLALEFRNALPFATGADGTAHSFVVLAVADALHWESVAASATPPADAKSGRAVMGYFRNNGTVFSVGTTDWARGLGAEANAQTIGHLGRITTNVIQTLGTVKTAEQRATLPVYRYHAVMPNSAWKFLFSTSPFINDGWVYDGEAFFGYQLALAGTIPIYVHHRVQTDGGWLFRLSSVSSLPGWVNSGVPTFYGYGDSGIGRIAIYEYSALDPVSGDVRYLYSPHPTIGSGWTLSSTPAFYAPAGA